MLVESLVLLNRLLGLVFVLATIGSMGLSLSRAQLMQPLRDARWVLAALVANFLVAPLAALALIQLLQLRGAMATGLLLVSLSAGAPGLPKLASFARVDIARATSLMLLLIVLTTLVLPLALPFVLEGASIGYGDVAPGLVLAILLPLAIGLLLRARRPRLADMAEPWFRRASTLSLAAVFLLTLTLNLRDLLRLLGSGGLLAGALLVLCCAAAGYALGRAAGASGWVQALGAGQRNIAVALLVAVINFGPQEIVFVVLFSIVSLALLVPPSLLGGRLRATGDRAV